MTGDGSFRMSDKDYDAWCLARQDSSETDYDIHNEEYGMNKDKLLAIMTAAIAVLGAAVAGLTAAVISLGGEVPM